VRAGREGKGIPMFNSVELTRRKSIQLILVGRQFSFWIEEDPAGWLFVEEMSL